MGKKSTLTPEQRAQLVLRLLSKEEPAVQIARRAGISEQTLYRWRDEFIGGGKQALNGRGRQAEQRKVVERLNRDIAVKLMRDGWLASFGDMQSGSLRALRRRGDPGCG